MIRLLLWIGLLLCFPWTVCAQKVQTVHGEYLYRAPENVTVEQARRTAVERARLQALADRFGTIVSQVNTTLAENRNGSSDLSFFSAGGSEVKGEWLEDTREPEISVSYEQGMLCIRALVWGRAREIVRSETQVDARLLRNGTELRSESDEFRDGDDFYLFFRTPVSGFLAVYLVDAEQRAYCLLPYLLDTANRVAVEKNRDYLFFSARHAGDANRSVDEYTLTCRQSVERNTVYVVFSENEFAKAGDRRTDETLPRELPFEDFQKWLTRSRMRDKTMTVVQKTITLKP